MRRHPPVLRVELSLSIDDAGEVVAPDVRVDVLVVGLVQVHGGLALLFGPLGQGAAGGRSHRVLVQVLVPDPDAFHVAWSVGGSSVLEERDVVLCKLHAIVRRDIIRAAQVAVDVHGDRPRRAAGDAEVIPFAGPEVLGTHHLVCCRQELELPVDVEAIFIPRRRPKDLPQPLDLVQLCMDQDRPGVRSDARALVELQALAIAEVVPVVHSIKLAASPRSFEHGPEGGGREVAFELVVELPVLAFFLAHEHCRSHRDVPVPALRDDLDVASLDRLVELSLDLRVLVRVAVEHAAAFDVFPRPLVVADLDLVRRHPLRVLGPPGGNHAGDDLLLPGVHDQELVVVVRARRPGLRRVETAPPMHLALRVVGPHARVVKVRVVWVIDHRRVTRIGSGRQDTSALRRNLAVGQRVVPELDALQIPRGFLGPVVLEELHAVIVELVSVLVRHLAAAAGIAVEVERDVAVFGAAQHVLVEQTHANLLGALELVPKWERLHLLVNVQPAVAPAVGVDQTPESARLVEPHLHVDRVRRARDAVEFIQLEALTGQEPISINSVEGARAPVGIERWAFGL
eukprot:2580405-Rhodomonas_salina.7